MADLERVRAWAEALINLHLDPTVWSFGFDNAKKRAGQCNWSTHRITVSRYLTAKADDDDIHQVLLHEVAHALAGPRAGHSSTWRQIAGSIGYEGSRLYQGQIANEVAPWVGTCPAGHLHYRHRRPSTVMACGRCSRRFDPANTITWQERIITAAARRAAIQ
ncbi:MAG TPA: SprT-like domain-containing protein [Glaciihabitans sp.]|nr:SprT-like domain-containing protein [Glaciihabitans sp.]